MNNKKFLKTLSIISMLSGSLFISACGDQVAAVLEGQEARAERYHEEGKAVGNACRHAGRAIEDCYTIYSWLPRSGIFEGWREMDKYMRKHNLETVKPILPPPENPNAPKKEESKKKKKKSKDKDSENADSSANNENLTAIEVAPLEPLAIEPINPDAKNNSRDDTKDAKDTKNKKDVKDEKVDVDPNKIKVETTPDGEIIIK